MSKFGNLQSPKIHRGMNWVGLRTFYVKECKRFLNIAAQTLAAPAVINLLYFTVFSLALKTNASPEQFAMLQQFLAPGIIMMTVMQNSFTSVSSALLVSKIQGALVDLLLAPLSALEITLGFLLSGITRGLLVGFFCSLPLALIIDLTPAHFFILLYFAVMGSLWMASLGLLGGILAEKFDHMNAFSNFIVTPLIFLSGTFYSVQNLHPTLQKIAHLDPFFYIIDGFRFGFLGRSDTHVYLSMLVVLVLNIIMGLLCWRIIQSGFRLRR